MVEVEVKDELGKRRLQEMQQHLQGVAIQAYPMGPVPPVVQPVAARVPIVAAPPPVYPGDALANAGRQMMQKYEIWTQLKGLDVKW